MTMPVSLCTVHHEGAGNPVDWARGGDGGYSIWIGDVGGDHVYDVLRAPDVSYATLDFNHVSLDICLSGDRDVVAFTDNDLVTLKAAGAYARGRGWVTDAPLVRPHKLSPGSSTVCPGNHTMARWPEVVAALTYAKPAPPIFSTGGMFVTTVATGEANAQGRIPTARPVVAYDAVLLENGARVVGDVPSGKNHTWVPAGLPPGAKLIDIVSTSGTHPFAALYQFTNGDVGTYSATAV